MHLGLQAHTAHANGLAHPFLVVHHIFLGQHMQGFLVRRDRHGLGRVNHPVDICLGHFPVADGDDAVGIEAAHMGTGDARIHRMNVAASHQLGLFHRPLDGAHGGFDIHHHTLLHPPGRLGADTDDFHGAIGG